MLFTAKKIKYEAVGKYKSKSYQGAASAGVALDGPHFRSGNIKLGPRSVAQFSDESTAAFAVISCAPLSVQVAVNKVVFCISAGDHFHMPIKGSTYRFTNNSFTETVREGAPWSPWWLRSAGRSF